MASSTTACQPQWAWSTAPRAEPAAMPTNMPTTSSQHPDLKAYLLGTDTRILVQASPLDAIWGMGLAATHRDAGNPSRWPGLNLLGFALMETRRQLAKHNGPEA